MSRTLRAAWVGLLVFAPSCRVTETWVADGARRAQVVAPREARASLVLIGDAGVPGDRETNRCLTALADEVARGRPEQTLLVFLGDNLYPHGLRETTAGFEERDAQRFERLLLAAAATGARTVFLPGNHDHQAAGPSGIRAQARFAARLARARGLADDTWSFLPRDAGPGPEVLDWDPGFRLIAFDSVAWMADASDLRYPVPGGGSARAPLLQRVQDSIRGADGRVTVVAAHHPIAGHGRHGGFHPWETHLFPLRDVARWAWLPLPGFGSLYVIARLLGVSSTDLASDRYAAFAEELRGLFASDPPWLYAAGHDHSLQVLSGPSGSHMAVSGAGSPTKVTEVGRGDDTLIASPFPGFMRLDLMGDGRVRLEVVEVRAVDDVRRVPLWLPPPRGVSATRRGLDARTGS